MSPEQYIAFDPTARIIRRMDIGGGAERRTGTLAREIDGNVRFYFRVIARHMPLRVALLLPAYPWVIYVRALGWILDDRGHEPPARQALAVAELTLKYPFLFARGVVRAFTAKPRAPARTEPLGD
jgi:hypothetical protein